MLTHLVPTIALLFQATCPRGVSTTDSSARVVERDADEAAVIAAAVAHLYGPVKPGNVVLFENTQPVLAKNTDSYRADLEDATHTSSEISTDYLGRNGMACGVRALLGDLPLATTALFVPKDFFAHAGKTSDDKWKEFYHQYPASQGEIIVSRPGFDASGTKAVLYIGRGCGGTCGAWGFAVLQKTQGTWVVAGYKITLLS